VSSNFDDFIIVSGSNKKVVKAVKKALKKKLDEDERICENTKHYPNWKHENVEPRPFKYGWNGFENAYEESVDLCDDCFEASQP
jgi:hypothetical protein